MINIPIDVSLAVALVGCVLGLAAFFDNRRKAAMTEGKHQAEVQHLEARVAAAEGTVKTLQACYQNTDADIREIRTDLEWIKAALGEIKDALAHGTVKP